MPPGISSFSSPSPSPEGIEEIVSASLRATRGDIRERSTRNYGHERSRSLHNRRVSLGRRFSPISDLLARSSAFAARKTYVIVENFRRKEFSSRSMRRRRRTFLSFRGKFLAAFGIYDRRGIGKRAGISEKNRWSDTN